MYINKESTKNEDKAIRMLDEALVNVDAYVTAKQSEVVLQAVNKLYEMKELSEVDYALALKRIVEANGFKIGN